MAGGDLCRAPLGEVRPDLLMPSEYAGSDSGRAPLGGVLPVVTCAGCVHAESI